MRCQLRSSVTLLGAEGTRAVEQAAMRGGLSGAQMMERAGRAAADLVKNSFSVRPTVILCGPGNNGGDGFVAARLLCEEGWPISVALLGERARLKGDAATMAAKWEGGVQPFTPAILHGAGVIIDALFGTGLSRPLDGAALEMVDAANASGLPIVAIDIPSGIDADTGAILGAAINAVRTQTFISRKPGHLLFPGRVHAGEVSLSGIGVDDALIAGVEAAAFANAPALWLDKWPQPQWDTHKYGRGHVGVISGPRLKTGAARLAARGALRAGAGLVTMFSPRNAADENAAHLTAIMLREVEDAAAIKEALGDPRFNVVVIGPGAGVGAGTNGRVLTILKSGASAVLDADALTSFSNEPARLFSVLRPSDILTPHAGEFARLFPDIAKTSRSRLEMARAAAKKARAVVVLKGADTIVASPDGRAAINENAPYYLATAGAGDVLAGFITGVKASGAPSFEAAAAGVFLHAAAAKLVGPGLIAEDIPEAAPAVLGALFQSA